MDKTLHCTHCDAETHEFRDLVAGMPHVNCPQGDGLWFESAQQSVQSDETTCARCGDSLQKHQEIFHDHTFQAPFRR